MVLTLETMPSLNYDLASVKRVRKTYRDGRVETYLSAATVVTETPSYLRGKFATHVKQFLEATVPRLGYRISSAENGLFVLGFGMAYDEETEGLIRRVRAKVDVSSGNDETREVTITPASMFPPWFLNIYERVLRRDLDRNGNGKII